jgi:general secretion pathway protein A
LTLSDPFGVARGYEQHFGLLESPFGLTPSRRFLFESESHRAAVEQITLAIRRREPLLVVTGAIGTGKTLLCRTIQAVEPRTFVSVISNPRLSGRDLLRLVLHDFDLIADQTGGVDEEPFEEDSDRILRQFLASLASLNARAVIVIDDAHRLAPDALEQVGALCSLDAGRQELLQVILVGRLELEVMLAQPALQPLAGRISRRHELQRLAPHEIAPYVEHRLAIGQGDSTVVNGARIAPLLAGERVRRALFTPVALRSLPALTRGLPRAINVICDQALDISWRQNKQVVDAGCVLAAARNLGVAVPFDVHLRSRWRYEVAAALFVVAGAGALALRATGLSAWPRAVPAESSTGINRETAPPPVAEAAAVVAPLPEAQSFSVTAASFRSETRAAEVVSSLRRLDLPVFVRQVDGSHAVVVGPFASREEAVEAQAQIARLHLTSSRIISTAPTQGAIVHPLRPVAMTGQEGQP